MGKFLGLACRLLLALAACFAASTRAQNYSDIWWNPQESGWGITIADHESQLFVVWYTYRQDGRPVWYTVPGGTFSSGKRLFQGDVYITRGPSYHEPSFDSSRVVATRVGTANFDFAPVGMAQGGALFSYNIGGVARTTQIQRQPFGNAAPDWGRDFTDLWFNPSESGWGLALSQHGNNIFGVWYTYDADGEPLWVVLPGVTFSASNRFTGKLYTTTGPYFGSARFDPNAVVVTEVGSATIQITQDEVAAAEAGDAGGKAARTTSVGSMTTDLCQGGTAAFEPLMNRAPLGTVRQTRLACPQPFGNARPPRGPRPGPKTCDGLYAASVARPGKCSNAGSVPFEGRVMIKGIDWTDLRQQSGTISVTDFVREVGWSTANSARDRICDLNPRDAFNDADLVVTLASTAAGVAGSGFIDIGLPSTFRIDFRINVVVNGSFAYSYGDDPDRYVGSGTFTCIIAP